MTFAKDLDLVPGQQYRVRVYASDRTNPMAEPKVAFEGLTSVELRPMVLVKSLGPRWELTLTAYPGPVAVAGTGPGGYDYHPGASMISFGEHVSVYLLERGDPEKPYGEDGPTLTEALEMALDTFCVTEGVDGVTFD